MSLFTHAKASRAAAKVAEELIYEQVAVEVAAGAIRQGLWAKAISESDGNEAAAKARYLKLRVEMINAEAELTGYASEQFAKDGGHAAKRQAQAERERRAGTERQAAADAWHASRTATPDYSNVGSGSEVISLAVTITLAFLGSVFFLLS